MLKLIIFMSTFLLADPCHENFIKNASTYSSSTIYNEEFGLSKINKIPESIGIFTFSEKVKDLLKTTDFSVYKRLENINSKNLYFMKRLNVFSEAEMLEYKGLISKNDKYFYIEDYFSNNIRKEKYTKQFKLNCSEKKIATEELIYVYLHSQITGENIYKNIKGSFSGNLWEYLDYQYKLKNEKYSQAEMALNIFIFREGRQDLLKELYSLRYKSANKALKDGQFNEAWVKAKDILSFYKGKQLTSEEMDVVLQMKEIIYIAGTEIFNHLVNIKDKKNASKIKFEISQYSKIFFERRV